MNDLKISLLPLIKELTGKEILPLVKDGSNVAAEGYLLKSFISGELYDRLYNEIQDVNQSILDLQTEMRTLDNELWQQTLDYVNYNINAINDNLNNYVNALWETIGAIQDDIKVLQETIKQ